MTPNDVILTSFDPVSIAFLEYWVWSFILLIAAPWSIYLFLIGVFVVGMLRNHRPSCDCSDYLVDMQQNASRAFNTAAVIVHSLLRILSTSQQPSGSGAYHHPALLLPVPDPDYGGAY
eukprot:scaffold10173_cov281-Chaetoceros_neogracile.AAC.12